MERQLVYEKENSEFKPVKLCIKIDLVSYPASAEELVNMGSRKKLNRKTESIDNIKKKQLRGLEGGSVIDIHRKLPKGTLKKVPN